MTNKVFIFNEVCPGGNYGIKTYIEQLSCSCFNMKNFEVHIVNLRSNVNEFTINHESGKILAKESRGLLPKCAVLIKTTYNNKRFREYPFSNKLF